MNDPQIAADLRARSSGALAELFDAYGDQLFRYCWSMLRNREIAYIALRDTLVVAEAHIARLADPELLGPWLYSLARAECRRRRAVQPYLADEPPARPSQHDGDSRLMAWNAATSMAADELEVLDLVCRHDVDPGLVLGLSTADTEALEARARQNLARALGAEILISRGSRACPDRAEVMRGWAGTMTPEIRERALEHAPGCPVCGPILPRNVSASRVLALLPEPAMSPDAWGDILEAFEDPRLSAYWEFAVNRTSALDESGFPARTLASVPAPVPIRSLAPAGASAEARMLGLPSPTRARSRLARPRGILAGVGAVAAVAVIACAFVFTGSGAKPVADRVSSPTMTAASPAGPAVERSTGVVAAGASTVIPRRHQVTSSVRTAATAPAVSQGEAMIANATQPGRPAQKPAAPQSPTTAPASSVSSATSTPAGTLTVSPGSITLTPGSAGQITLTAVGGPVTWSASASAPQVALSTEGGTLQAGQNATLYVTVSQDSDGGNAIISIEPPASSPQTVEVSWDGSGSPSHSGRRWHSRQDASDPDPSRTAPPQPSSLPAPATRGGTRVRPGELARKGWARRGRYRLRQQVRRP